VSLFIPATLSINETDTTKLIAVINQNILKLSAALAGDLQWYSQNALLVPDSFVIISISAIAPSFFKMHYHYQWNVFNACLNINESETQTETVTFQVVPEGLLFDIIENQRPSPADEL